MIYRRMGKSGLQLSALSFGSWITFNTQIDDKKATQLMSLAYDNGVNFFDNAEVYSSGESEKMMGRVLKKQKWERSSYVLSSKAYFGWRGKENKPNQRGLSRKHLTEACHEALVRMNVTYLDLFFCHRPDKETPIEEVVRTMNTLIQQGKILYWGTSEWSAVEIMEAHLYAAQNHLEGPCVEQPQYNLFERQKMEQEYTTLFKNWGMGTTIWSPLASGILTGKYNKSIPKNSRLNTAGYEWLKERLYQESSIKKTMALEKIAADLGASLAALSIAWCLSNPHVSTAILGATKDTQLKENFKAIDLLPKLTDEVKNKIEKIMNNKPIQPEY